MREGDRHTNETYTVPTRTEAIWKVDCPSGCRGQAPQVHSKSPPLLLMQMVTTPGYSCFQVHEAGQPCPGKPRCEPGSHPIMLALPAPVHRSTSHMASTTAGLQDPHAHWYLTTNAVPMAHP